MPNPLEILPNVKKVVSRGKPYYYFQRKGLNLIPLPNPLEAPDLFLDAYEVAKSTPLVSELADDIRAAIRQTLKRASTRSKEKGMAFDLTYDFLCQLFVGQNGLCAMTGIKMTTIKKYDCRRNPFAPSIDRIDSSEGYIVGNVQYVTAIANIAKSDYGEAPFYAMCTSVRNKRGT